MADYKKMLLNLLFFSEPQKKEDFILKETQTEKQSKKSNARTKSNENKKEQSNTDDKDKKQSMQNSGNKNKDQENKDNSQKKNNVSKKLSENLNYIKNAYTIPVNGDMILREFDIVVKNKVIPAFLIFFDGMTDRRVINNDILQPLMLLSNLDIKSDENDIAEYVRSHLLPHGQLKEMKDHNGVINEVNFGGCGLYIDGIASAFAADVKGWEHRSVERPNTELIIRGPQEGFNEILRVNTALIRKRLKDENLIVENIEIGKRSKTPCSMLYIKDIANDSLVAEVRRRLKSIKVDYISDTGELEQYIEDSSFLPSPLVVATERPDRTASMLTDGRVAIIMNGSPFALIVPITNNDLIHSAEDMYIRFPFANLLRLVRIIAVFFSLLLPGLYIAITNYHQEMIPTDLLFSLEASRERVPFPSVIEVLIMEIAFELIREAGIRIPGPIGPTLGIVGALILGQAAVSASIVSPILIIIVAVTGICSFAIPNFSLAFSFRILRFGFIFLGAIAGLLGITLGLFIQGLWFVNTKSFGVPFMAPFAPKTAGGAADQFLRAPIWKQERRPDYFNAKNETRQRKISRLWVKRNKEGGTGNEGDEGDEK